MRQLFILLFFFGMMTMVAQDSDAFQKANEAYKAKDYNTAINVYEGLLSQPLTSNELHYNLGNAYYQNGNIAKAILNYEKALKVSPSNAQTAKNLAIAQEEVDLQVLKVPDFFLARWWKGIARLLKPNIWVALQFLTGILFVIGVWLWKFKHRSSINPRGIRLAATALAALPFFYLLGASSDTYYSDSDAAIIMKKSNLLSEPHQGAEEVEMLTPGVKLRLLDKVDEWYKVSLQNKEQGWVEVRSVEII